MRMLVLSAMLLPLSFGNSVAQDQAGVSAAVRGEVQFVAAAPRRNAVIGRKLASGEPVFMGDRIGTGPESSLQLMLLDETTLSIGPGSSVTVDNFVYDPARGGGKVTLDVARGAFRFISGRIARDEPRNVEIRTPAGTIGIRGTIVVGRVDELGRVLVVLAGPGGANNAGNARGGFDFVSPSGTVSARQPGWGVNAEPGSLARSVQLTPVEIDALGARVQPQRGPEPRPLRGPGEPSRPPGPGPSPGDEAGQAKARGFDNLSATRPIREDARAFDNKALIANQAAQQIADRATTIGELRLLTQGIAVFQQLNVPMSRVDLGTADGSYNFNLVVNLANRTFQGGFSNINAPSQGVTSATMVTGGALSYANTPAGSFAGLPFNSVCGAAACSGNFTLLNVNAIIAKNARHFVNVDSGGGVVTRGVGVAIR